jgi:SAM-dependent methyltransferase
MSYRYDSEFFDFVNASSGKSASLFLAELILNVLGGRNPASVLDVGCGRGAWLAAWMQLGLERVQGLDGAYVDTQSLLIPASGFRALDISKPFDLHEKFALVECLEVAEHIPQSNADTLIDNLVRHGDLILFSAAIPGQGGEFHVNEQPYSYWRAKFAARGFEAYDAVRPHVAHYKEIEPWYRYNALLFGNPAGASLLSEAARSTLVPSDTPVAEVAPFYWRARCAAIALLPNAVSLRLARLKHRAANLVH